jgi:hypothetical protein
MDEGSAVDPGRTADRPWLMSQVGANGLTAVQRNVARRAARWPPSPPPSSQRRTTGVHDDLRLGTVQRVPQLSQRGPVRGDPMRDGAHVADDRFAASSP